VDSLPAAADMGPGSPTGVEFYDHFAFPAKYRGAMFGCDWSTGKIHAITFERVGASYRGKSEVFLEGRPLNATDIAVGPDGALYFSTGGRGTDGGIYRVRCETPVPAAAADMGQGIERALRQPQIDADWARARAAGVKQQLGEAWGPELTAIALDAKRPTDQRLRAVDLLMYFGPLPSDELLTALAGDADAMVRAKAARLMFQSDDASVRTALAGLLRDHDALVRRCACESLGRRGALPGAADVLPLLGDSDRFVAFAARRVIEQLPVNEWAAAVLHETNTTAFCNGAIALVNVERKAPTSKAVAERCVKLLAPGGATVAKRLSETERLAVLRTLQVALLHGKLDAAKVPTVGGPLLAMYPTGDRLADRELVRLLVYLQVVGAADKFAAELEKDIPLDEKLHIAAYSARLERGWSTPAKLALLKYYEQFRKVEGGYSVDKYVENFTRDFLTQLTMDERRHIISNGEKWPATALSTLAKLPEGLSADFIGEIVKLDGRVAPKCAEGDQYRRLRVGIIAVLGASKIPAAQEHLRAMYRDEPEYRDPVAMSLAQQPAGENWSYLVDSLKTAEKAAAQDILTALATVPQRPSEASAYRSVILMGMRLGENGGDEAVQLLAHWSGDKTPTASDDQQAELAHWQAWYAEKFPQALPAELPADAGQDKWSYQELLTFLESEAGKAGDARRGEEAFAKAQCASCHRVGNRGETAGPDLTSVARRFQRKEILEAIVYPSHDVSDQYASKVVIAGGKTYTGLVTSGDRGMTVLLPTGKKVELRHAEIDDVQPSQLSAMPTGLLNSLTLEQVADLFAYLGAQGPASVASGGGGARK
jgi:putative heme-binding domain-containing protein